MDGRAHVGAGAPIVRLRWVFTDQPFFPVGTGCVILDRIWDIDQWSELPVGQRPPKVANYDQDDRFRLPAGMQPGHVCHPEWLATGEPWPNDLPPNVYGPNWIPECCGLFQRPVTLPLALGFTVGVRYYPPAPVTLPLALGLSVGVVYTPPPPVVIPLALGFTVGVLYDGASGVWVRDTFGDYVFTAAFTGNHLVRLYGAGAKGADASDAGGMLQGGGGGGGGAESDSTLSLVAGTSYAVRVGKGGDASVPDGGFTRIVDGVTVLTLAAGGHTGTLIAGGAGGQGTDGVGDVRWNGGAGADGAVFDFGGGGGSSGCYSPSGMPPGDGTDASDRTGAVPPLPDGGPGGDGGTDPDGGSPGGYSGGGGGGSGADATDPGGNGWDGRIVIIWPAP